jgi:hypothetical protein
VIRIRSVKQRPVLLAMWMAVTFVLVDLVVGAWLIEDGMFRGRPLPPFGVETNPGQRAWLLAEQGGNDAGSNWFDAELGWTNQPSTPGTSPDGFINSIGARGTREYEAVAPVGVTRIACFGDSYTYGDEVPYGQDWASQLEGMDPALEVMNFGVPAYGTDQALLRFRRLAPSLDADVFVLGILVENIGRNVNRYRPLYYPRTMTQVPKPRFVLDGERLRLVELPFSKRTELVRAVTDGSILERVGEHEYWDDASRLGWLGHSSIARFGAAWFAYRRRQPESLWQDTDGEPFRVSIALLDAFAAEALEAGASRALVLVFPREKELDAMLKRDDKYWQPLLDELQRRAIPFIDLADALAGHHREARAKPDVAPIYRGGHFSPKGNRIVAGRVLEGLTSARPSSGQ